MSNFFGLWFFGLTFFIQLASSAEISQFIYEDLNKIKCEKATMNEANSVRCGLKSSFSKVQADVDEIIESMVFQNLGSMKASETRCSEKILTQIVNSPDIREQLAEQTCEQIGPLVQYWKSIDSLEKEIKSYETITDRRLRPIDEPEFQRNLNVIRELKSFKTSFEVQLAKLIGIDTLLTSPTILSRLKDLSKSSWYSKNRTTEEICKVFKLELPKLLSKEHTAIKEKAAALEKFAEDPNGFKNILVKKNLWTSGGREKMKVLLGNDPDMARSTLCRMEGRYGTGLETMTHLSMIASIGVGGVSFLSGKLVSTTAANGVGAARLGLGALTLAEFGIGAALSATHSIQACVSDKANTQTGKFCNQMSPTEIQSLLRFQVNSQTCVRSVTLSAFSTVLGGLGARSVLKSNGRPNVINEIEARIVETRKVSLAKSLNSSSDDISAMLNGLRPDQQQRVLDAMELASKQVGSVKVNEWIKTAAKRNNCK